MMNLKVVWVMAQAFTKAFFRNKVAIFFTFLFPLVFLLIFGFIFGREATPSFEVGLIKQAQTQLAQDFEDRASATGVFKFQTDDSQPGFETKLGRGQIDALVILPEDFGLPVADGQVTGRVQLLYNQSDQELATTMSSILETVLEQLDSNLQVANQTLVVETQALQTADLSRFDYIFAGLLGFSILSLGIFSMSEGFLQDKKSKALLRIKLAPVRAWQLILATVFNRVLVGLIAVAIMFVVGILVFDFSMRGDYFNLALFTALALVCMLGFGTAIAGWAQNSNQSAPIANLISFPMMFLSGVFFPIFLMPEWLQQITTFIPLAAITDGLRLITTESQTLLDLGPQLLVISIWSLGLYTLAAKTFRWQ